ncbi:Mesoderm induction early response protein 3 [Liparis tanakae]|uniref:Mesoderm induction early response protein 3 n=1 Tax=Liparis tanakae TaxID=230148 RepID=A0A4Z2EXP3_9TELE|nr:Mesoderm induction early response protein 3 [Liparis tanakae]
MSKTCRSRALNELDKCNYNIREALERHCLRVKSSKEKSPPWSEEECKNFEHALQMYDKNFHLIQKHKLRWRGLLQACNVSGEILDRFTYVFVTLINFLHQCITFVCLNMSVLCWFRHKFIIFLSNSSHSNSLCFCRT